jgi:hypothetical protein
MLSAPRSRTSSSRWRNKISLKPSIISRNVAAEYVFGLASDAFKNASYLSRPTNQPSQDWEYRHTLMYRVMRFEVFS